VTANSAQVSEKQDGLRRTHHRLLAEIATHDDISRGDLADALDLPLATVTSLVRDLIGRGLVVSHEGTPAHGRGRPPEVLTLTGPATAIGLIRPGAGGLRLAIAALSGRVVAERTHPVDVATFRLDDAARRLDELAAESGYATSGLARVVLSVPAPYQRGVGAPARRSPEGKSFAPWALTDLAGELARLVGTEVVVENDANLGALGEHAFGAGRGRQSLVYVMLGSSSVGAGLVINGGLHRGATGFAGELAHIQIDDDGPLCPCGGRGCLIHAGAALLRSAQSAYDESLTYPRILAMAAGGDPGLGRLLGDFGRQVGRPLADVCTMLNPEAIIIGGAAGPGGKHIVDGVREAIDRYAAPPAAEALSVLAGETADRADLLGAVALARREISR
jgi:predicted NBD/HSP70 family sugar kinase